MSALVRCVGEPERFVAEFWSRAPHHRSRADPAAFSDLFGLDDVDTLVTSSLLRAPALRMVQDGRPLAESSYTTTSVIGGQRCSGVVDAARVLAQFSAGATLVLQTLHRYWAPVTTFCRALELELTHPVQANAYVTPGKEQGLVLHHDTHDVFVLQVAGRKHWTIYEPAMALPLRQHRWQADVHQPGPVLLDTEIGAGDVLYVPRGFPHQASSTRHEVSAHLTIGVLAYTWMDVINELLAGAADEPDFRQALPIGFASPSAPFDQHLPAIVERLAKHLESADLEELAGRMVRRFWSSRPPNLVGQLRQLRLAESLSDSSRVRRRAGTSCHVVHDGDHIIVLSGGRQLRMPGALYAPLQLLIDGRTFLVQDLDPFMDEASRLVFVRRLVREALLEVVPG